MKTKWEVEMKAEDGSRILTTATRNRTLAGLLKIGRWYSNEKPQTFADTLHYSNGTTIAFTGREVTA
jgi:hypothetical protein